jgi:hypothetical protein
MGCDRSRAGAGPVLRGDYLYVSGSRSPSRRHGLATSFRRGAIHRARLRSGRNATDAPGKIDSPILNTQRHVTTPPDHGRLRNKCVLVRQTFCLPSVEALPGISALTDSSSHYIGQNRQRL